ncbi:WXG100 family type VII secretion target [Nocardia bhagyanarayanae]|uniref:Type VII secretion system (Wss) protein ESAT-6 n=1 Tax=Nocardia bhagyanarayanae TaxID=1215925 RepID=A0A543F4Z5_9NOCA|nr:WXG100 family type VII secretion target [Nocardia bhagyanarayanae]TQM28898.1 type VII secretion system (Wss) protein ESAT-6 [Nocardia bhagyanarayanae]
MNENEPARITDGGERPNKYKHFEISGAFNPLQPANAYSIAGRYSDLSAQWEAGVEVFNASIQKSIAGAWEGNAANNARDAIQRYTKSAHDLTTPLSNLSTRVWAAAQAIVDTNSRLPEPVEEKPWWHKDSWPWVGTNRDGVIEDRQEEAQAVMKDYYVTPFVDLDGQIPVLPKPIDPTNPLDISAPTKDTGDDDGNGNGGPTNTGVNNGDDPEGTEDPTTGEPGTEDDPTDEPTTEDTSTDPTSTDTTPSSTTPAGTDPTKPGANQPTVPTGTNPAGTPGGPGPGIPGPGTGTPSPGRGIPGTPGAPGASPAGAAAAAATPARGMAGMPGMGGLGARPGGKSEDDADHKIPEYLITMENTEELLGELPKTAPGGVIGEHPPE